MSISWYVQRLKTFSVQEVFYRIKQHVRTHMLDKRLFRTNQEHFTELFDSAIIQDATLHSLYPVFEKSVDIFKTIEWHVDIQSQKKFPKKFAHNINIRDNTYGSAKHVWEINRHLFLVHLAKLYKETSDSRYIDLIFYHLSHWKKENPYLTGVNWYSNIEINIRLINWYYCWNLLNIDALQHKSKKVKNFVNNVWFPLIELHAKYSYEHPSLYSSANNHLIAEYAGLFVAAVAWKISNAKHRLSYAKKGLECEILKQNAKDGINKEEAAEYIQFIDDFFLIAVTVGEKYGIHFSTCYKERLHSMAHYLNAMLDCQGNYPMYGDGDDGFLLRLDVNSHFNNFTSLLSSFASYFKDSSLKRKNAIFDEKSALILGESESTAFNALNANGDIQTNSFFKDSGHFIFRQCKAKGFETYLHFDAAKLGFLSIAAHGHADALSIILHVDGFPVLVDSGTFTYHTHRNFRNYFVSTRAHNTVCVNGLNQATLAGPTMWLHHFHTKVLDITENSVTATHDGYQKIGVSHIRKVTYNAQKDEFDITDSLKGNGSFTVEIPFHLHPNVSVSLINHTATLSFTNSRHVVIELDEKLPYEILYKKGNEKSNAKDILGWYSIHFGECISTNVLYAKMLCDGSATFNTKIKIL